MKHVANTVVTSPTIVSDVLVARWHGRPVALQHFDAVSKSMLRRALDSGFIRCLKGAAGLLYIAPTKRGAEIVTRLQRKAIRTGTRVSDVLIDKWTGSPVAYEHFVAAGVPGAAMREALTKGFIRYTKADDGQLFIEPTDKAAALLGEYYEKNLVAVAEERVDRGESVVNAFLRKPDGSLTKKQILSFFGNADGIEATFDRALDNGIIERVGRGRYRVGAAGEEDLSRELDLYRAAME